MARHQSKTKKTREKILEVEEWDQKREIWYFSQRILMYTWKTWEEHTW